MCQGCVDNGNMTISEMDQIQANIRDGNHHDALLLSLAPILKGQDDAAHYAELAGLVKDAREMAESYNGFTAEQATACLFAELGSEMGKASALWFVAAMLVALHRKGSL